MRDSADLCDSASSSDVPAFAIQLAFGVLTLIQASVNLRELCLILQGCRELFRFGAQDVAVLREHRGSRWPCGAEMAAEVVFISCCSLRSGDRRFAHCCPSSGATSCLEAPITPLLRVPRLPDSAEYSLAPTEHLSFRRSP